MYKFVKGNFLHVKFVCLVTIDKYVDGGIVQLRKYLLEKRK